MRIVDEYKKFKFKGLCPYCGGDLTYMATDWQKHPAKLFWKPIQLESQCSNEPEDMMSEEWNEWMQQHSDMPYVHQLPVDERVRRFIEVNYRFRLKSNEAKR